MSILAITSMRNEGPYCVEWVAHHLAAGFSNFLIYSNDCDDGTDAILGRLDRAGIITHVPFQPSGEKSIQWQVLKAVERHAAYKGADWAMFFDCDEFVNLRAPYQSISDVIAALPPEAEAMALRWRLFGNAGILEAPGDLTIAAYDRAAPDDVNLPLAHFFKTLFRPASFAKPGVHRPRAARMQRWSGLMEAVSRWAKGFRARRSGSTFTACRPRPSWSSSITTRSARPRIS